MNKTVKMNNSNQTRPQNDTYSNRLWLKSDVVFEGKHDSYEISSASDSIMGVGGESIVYLARRLSDGKTVAAKINDQFKNTPHDEYVRNRVAESLTENSNFEKTNLMPLLDYGFISIEGYGSEVYKKPIDIIPLCKDGQLKKSDYATLRGKIIPSILNAINTIHTAGIVHGDIKVSNVYEYDGNIVLADFGTARILPLGVDENTAIIHTRNGRGTPGYAAPEVSGKYAKGASDYYSLGCTIATLYVGAHIYEHYMNEDDEGSLNYSMRNEGLPLSCPECESDLQILVNALTVDRDIERAGYDDVNQWMTDTSAFINKWGNKSQRIKNGIALGFIFGDKSYESIPKLSEAFLDRWDDTKRYLYRGIIPESFKTINQALADKAFSIIEDKETAHNDDLGLARFMHFLNTSHGSATCPIYWQGHTFYNLREISTALENKTIEPSSVIALLKNKFLSWKSKQEEKSEESIRSIEEIEAITAMNEQLGYCTFLLRLSDDMTGGFDSPDAMFAKLTKSNWYDNAQLMLAQNEYLPNLINLGYKEAVLQMKKQLTGTFVSDTQTSDLTHIYSMFDAICKNQATVRNHFIQRGPLSYLYWFQQNLGRLYSFSSSEKARTVKGHILSVKLDSSMTIRELHNKKFLSLKQHLKDFMPLFNNNMLSAHYGIHHGKDKNGITPVHRDAFFNEQFYGISVPVGYRRYMENS